MGSHPILKKGRWSTHHSFPLPKRLTKTKCFISHYDFRMVCDSPPPPFFNRVVQKITWWFISHYDFDRKLDRSMIHFISRHRSFAYKLKRSKQGLV